MAAALDIRSVTLGEICGDAISTHTQLSITDLVLDSRDVRPGAAFFALPGSARHGIEFAEDALKLGASVVLFDPEGSQPPADERYIAVANLRSRLGEFARRFYGDVAARVEVTGVTGTNGKTTVAWLLAQALTQVGRTAGYIGTLGYGVAPQLSEHRLTTPDCLSLHREIALMPVSDVALEVSSHGLSQSRLDGIDVCGAVFTNLSHDHLDAHGSMQAYADVKASLFAREELEHAVINADDAWAQRMVQAAHHGVRVLTTSLQDDSADLRAQVSSAGLAGVAIDVRGLYGDARISTPLIGSFNASNVLQVLGALVNLDVPFADACAALEHCAAPPGRMEVFGGGAAPWVLVDYAHTPDALARVLAAVAGICDGDMWCVFGCGGDRDTSKRAAMGAAAGRAQHVVLTDDNPRSEDPAEIVAGILAGLGEHPDVIVEHDRARAIEQTITRAQAGDVVVVAGRGHERQQIVAAGAVAFDDRVIVRAALEGGAS